MPQTEILDLPVDMQIVLIYKGLLISAPGPGFSYVKFENDKIHFLIEVHYQPGNSATGRPFKIEIKLMFHLSFFPILLSILIESLNVFIPHFS